MEDVLGKSKVRTNDGKEMRKKKFEYKKIEEKNYLKNGKQEDELLVKLCVIL